MVLSLIEAHAPDLILLDVMLPSIDGMQLCKQIRQLHSVPIIMITARVEESDRLMGLELGADDYVCKPFSPRELIARVRALLRRQHMATHAFQPSASAQTIEAGLQLDEQNQQAVLGAQRINLTLVEFRLLKRLHSSVGKVLSRPQLMLGLYDDHRVVSERTVDSHLKNLRKKFVELGLADPITAVYGLGYKLKLR
jgi:two-component system, OmpR family, response regulator BaeR